MLTVDAASGTENMLSPIMGHRRVKVSWWWGETSEVQGADLARSVFGGVATRPAGLQPMVSSSLTTMQD